MLGSNLCGFYLTFTVIGLLLTQVGNWNFDASNIKDAVYNRRGQRVV